MRTNAINCIAVDDELSSLKTIREYCSRSQLTNLIGTFTNPYEALNTLNNSQVDLIFIDIVLPQIKGNEFLKTLYNPPMVIFTTAHRELAIEGFDVDAVDYLIKPLGFERFSKAVSKAYQLLRLRNHVQPLPEEATVQINDFLMVKVEYTTIRVDLNEILYIEGLKDYVKIYTEGKLILTKTTMKNIMEKLPPSSFFRVHKSYIVSASRIDMIENSRIVIGTQRIPIGESFRSSFFEMVNRYLV